MCSIWTFFALKASITNSLMLKKSKTSYAPKAPFPSEVKPNDGIAPYFRIIAICQITIVFLIIAFIVVRLSQFQDVLRSMDFLNEKNGIRNSLITYLITIWWGWNCWFWSQTLLSLRKHPKFHLNNGLVWNNKNHNLKGKIYVFLVENLPRLLGALAILLVGYAFFKAFTTSNDNDFLFFQKWIYFVCYFFTAILFYTFFFYRSRITKITTLQKVGIKTLPRAYKRMFESSPQIMKQNKSFYWAFGLSVGFWLITFLFFTIDSVGFAHYLNTAGIFLLGLSGWVALLSFIYHFTRRYNFPLVVLLFGWTIFCSSYNDNHQVRFLEENSSQYQPVTRQHPDSILSTYFINWLKQKQKEMPVKQDTFPVILIAAEGGGIRSAYWTASILSALQQSNSAFANHVFAISSVSGGSVGASVFTAVLAHSLKNPGNTNINSLSKDVLSEDHLSPLVAKLLYPDMLQKVIPFPVQSFDRAHGLEKSWEKAWERSLSNESYNEMKAAYGSVWEKPGLRYKIPLLLLNTTSVEQGIRGVLSPVSLAEINNQKIPSIVDLGKLLHGRIRLRTAAGIGARFPYVTPAAIIPISEDKAFHVVDGGYFENLGGATLLDVHSVISNTYESTASKENLPANLKFYVITITNYFSVDNVENIEPLETLHDLQTPISSMLNAWDARTPFSLVSLQNAKGIQGVVQFDLLRKDSLNTGNISVPLGWQISGVSVREMERQLRSKRVKEAIMQVEKYLNSTNKEKIVAAK